MAAGKIHIGKNGPGPCRAKIKCRLGGASGEENHFDTLEEAQAVYEARVKAEQGEEKKLSKKAVKQAAPSPSGCAVCGAEERGHGQSYHEAAGLHGYQAPSQEQRKERLLAQRGTKAAKQAAPAGNSSQAQGEALAEQRKKQEAVLEEAYATKPLFLSSGRPAGGGPRERAAQAAVRSYRGMVQEFEDKGGPRVEVTAQGALLMANPAHKEQAFEVEAKASGEVSVRLFPQAEGPASLRGRGWTLSVAQQQPEALAAFLRREGERGL